MTAETPTRAEHPMFNRSHYDEDRAYLTRFITERIAHIAVERTALLAVDRDLADLPDRTLAPFDCPVCGVHAVHDLRPLYALGHRLISPFHGGSVIDPSYAAGGCDISVASTYECASCHGFAVEELGAHETRSVWTRDSISDGNTSLAAALISAFPQIEEVIYRYRAAEWHVRVGLNLWWCYAGLKASILENLMLDRPRRKGRRYGARTTSTH